MGENTAETADTATDVMARTFNVALDDGREVSVSIADIEAFAADENNRMLEESGFLEVTALGRGTMRMDFHTEKLDPAGLFGYEAGQPIPIALGTALDLLMTDIPYFVLFKDEDSNGEVWACTDGAVFSNRAGAWESRKVELTLGKDMEPATVATPCIWEPWDNGEKKLTTLGKAGMDPDNLYSFVNTETGRTLLFSDVLVGAGALWAQAGAVMEALARQEKEARSLLPRQDVGTLHRQSDPTSKVVHAMTDPDLFKAVVDLDVAGRGEKRKGREVTTAVTFSWEGEGLEIYRPISKFDREIHGAVSSLWADGQRVITPHQIAKATGIKSPTPKQLERVVESVELQRRVMANIDFTEEARGRTLAFEGEPVTSFKLNGYLIAADHTQILTANGRVVDGYVLLRPPLVYQHAAILGQVTSYPQRMLALGDGRDTEKNVLLRRELLRRVYQIRNAWDKARTEKQRGEVNRNIRFIPDRRHPNRTSLFEYAGVNVKDRDARKAAADYVASILDGVASHEGIDFKPIREKVRGGLQTVGVEIILATD